MKLYIKQAWQLMKQNGFYSAIYIVGTGLAIALVMVIAIVYYVKTADIAPEVNRSRLLLSENGSAIRKDGESTWNWAHSYQTLKACYYSLETPELVTASVDIRQAMRALGDIYISVPGSDIYEIADIGATDANHWQVFRYTFLEGKPYTQEEFESGYRKVVLSESLARKLFGNERDLTGREVLINDVEFVVGGVVKDVSPAMSLAYANLWIPFTSFPVFTESEHEENIVGSLRAYMLAHKTADFDAIRDELDQKIKQYNTQLVNWEFSLRNRPPSSHAQEVIRLLDFSKNNTEIIRQYLLIILVFLLVPAINLSGLTSSRMRERIPEMGIRKAFGARWTTLVRQVLTENLFLTLLGGLVGLIVSYGLVLVLSNFLFLSKYSSISTDVALSPGMLMNFSVFFIAFLVCVVLNLASSLVPVWSASRKNIVEAINDK